MVRAVTLDTRISLQLHVKTSNDHFLEFLHLFGLSGPLVKGDGEDDRGRGARQGREH